MKRICTLALWTAALMAAPAQSPDVQFRAAQQKETVEGDLNAAIAMYRKLADDRATPPDVAARASCGWDGATSGWETRKRARHSNAWWTSSARKLRPRRKQSNFSRHAGQRRRGRARFRRPKAAVRRSRPSRLCGRDS